MAQSQTPRQKARIDVTDLREGDRVAFGVNLHGDLDDYPGAQYARDARQTVILGTVTEELSEHEREMLNDDVTPMADLSVEDETGQKWTWNVDNGYVLSQHAGLGRWSDVGRFGGAFDPDALGL